MIVSPSEIQEQVTRIAASPAFVNSERMRDLLRYAVAQALAGQGSSLKESVLGVAIFGRKPGYDSDASSIVRVEFARLRKKLQQYYDAEGANERWRIVFPKGSYAPGLKQKLDRDGTASVGSVAVLPFACLSGAADDEYFADGLTDELITALTRVPGLKVVARTSSFMFKGRNEDIRGVGTTLQVETAIEGSLRREGDLLRVHVQLVNAKDGCHLWAAKYERRIT